MMAFDPFLDELVVAASGVEPASLSEMLSRSDFISMHLPPRPRPSASSRSSTSAR
jgi:D-3-phosphoglycerate dehydrogenase